MKVYKCIVTDDELFTDTYPIKIVKGMYRIQGKLVTRAAEQLDESKFGSNPSAEETDEGGASEGTTSSGVNIVLDNRLQETGFGSKKEFTAYFKEFSKKMMESVKEKDPDRSVEEFQKGVSEAFKELVVGFKDIQFFQGSSNDPDGTIIVCKWETPEGETDEVPFFYVCVDAVKEEKF